MSDQEQRLQDLERRVQALEARLSGPSAPIEGRPKQQSAKEFLMTKNAGAETQKVLAFAYFLERQEGFFSFNVPDLEAVFRGARERPPKNMNDAVNKNVARGFLMEAKEKKDSKKTWQLTATGERFVEGQMSR
jgi:hypothetical protein